MKHLPLFLRQFFMLLVAASLLSFLPPALAATKPAVASPALLATTASLPGESLQQSPFQSPIETNAIGYAVTIVMPMMLFILLVAAVRLERPAGERRESMKMG